MQAFLLLAVSLQFWHKSVFQLTCALHLELCNRLDCYHPQTERGCTFCWTLIFFQKIFLSLQEVELDLCFAGSYCRLSLVLSVLWTYFFITNSKSIVKILLKLVMPLFCRESLLHFQLECHLKSSLLGYFYHTQIAKLLLDIAVHYFNALKSPIY